MGSIVDGLLNAYVKNSVKLTGNFIKFPAENVSKNYLLTSQKYSVDIDYLSFQRKNFVMIIQQKIKQIYGDLFLATNKGTGNVKYFLE